MSEVALSDGGAASGGKLKMRLIEQRQMRRGFLFRNGGEALVFVGCALTAFATAVMAKESGASAVPPLAAVETSPASVAQPLIAATQEPFESPQVTVDRIEEIPLEDAEESIRYFDGRPVRPARTVWMTVTAYSPDRRSCGKWADGVTASNKSIWTNGMKLVAADKRWFRFGSLVSVPGYDNGRVVPVLDRGGKIKGARLDVLYPTHEIARGWGVQKLPVTVWEYADDEAS